MASSLNGIIRLSYKYGAAVSPTMGHTALGAVLQTARARHKDTKLCSTKFVFSSRSIATVIEYLNWLNTA